MYESQLRRTLLNWSFIATQSNEIFTSYDVFVIWSENGTWNPALVMFIKLKKSTVFNILHKWKHSEQYAMLTKLVKLLSCTICFLGIIVFNYFQVVQSIDVLVVYSLRGVTIMGNSVIDIFHFQWVLQILSINIIRDAYQVLLSAGKECLLKSWFKCHDGSLLIRTSVVWWQWTGSSRSF